MTNFVFVEKLQVAKKTYKGNQKNQIVAQLIFQWTRS